MQLAHRAALNGVQLDEIDPRIIIKRIESGAGKETVTAVAAGSGDGTRITVKRRDMVEVQVRFGINIRRDALEERAAVLEAVNAWAVKCGYLTVNYKPDRRLYIDDVACPGEGDPWERTTEYTITLRARSLPYWEQATQVIGRTGIGTDGLGSFQVPGSAQTVADVELQNMSGAEINTAQIVVAGRGMWFNSLGMGGSEALRITHNEKGILAITVGNRSVMALRTEASADDLVMDPGAVAFGFTAQRACRMTVSCRGRFV